MEKLIDKYQKSYVNGTDEAYSKLPEHDDEHIRKTNERLRRKHSRKRLANKAIGTVAGVAAIFAAATAAHEVAQYNQEQPKTTIEQAVQSEKELPYHIMKDKETLRGVLGQMYGYENIDALVEEAKVINGIEDARRIIVGQKVYLPSPSSEVVFDK